MIPARLVPSLILDVRVPCLLLAKLDLISKHLVEAVVQAQDLSKSTLKFHCRKNSSATSVPSQMSWEDDEINSMLSI